jgi:hypothetical protein
VSYPSQLSSYHYTTLKEYKKTKKINLSHIIFILNFIFTILFYMMRRTTPDTTYICFEEFLNQKPFESNFQFLTAQKSFPAFISFFSVLALQYSFSYLSRSSHTLSHIFSLVQSTVRPNRAFGPLTKFHLVIFDLQTPAAAFGLPSYHAALRYVIRLQHCEAASPPPPLPLRKRSHPIASPSLFPSPITGAIQVALSLPSSP